MFSFQIYYNYKVLIIKSFGLLLFQNFQLLFSPLYSVLLRFVAHLHFAQVICHVKDVFGKLGPSGRMVDVKPDVSLEDEVKLVVQSLVGDVDCVYHVTVVNDGFDDPWVFEESLHTLLILPHYQK